MKTRRSTTLVSTGRRARLAVVFAMGSVLGILGAATHAPAWAQDFPQGTTVQAMGFYDTKTASERLVAVILHPVGNGAESQLRSGPSIVRRILGTGRPEQFAKTVEGMKRKALVDKGHLLAAVYSISAGDGDYANVVSYLFGGTQIVVEDPANLKPIEGTGTGHGGGGGRGGGGGAAAIERPGARFPRLAHGCCGRRLHESVAAFTTPVAGEPVSPAASEFAPAGLPRSDPDRSPPPPLRRRESAGAAGPRTSQPECRRSSR